MQFSTEENPGQNRKASLATSDAIYEIRRFPRKRTLSWADMPIEADVPFKLLSPQLSRRSPTAKDLALKQIQSVKATLEEQSKLLKEAIELKQAKAEKNREIRIKGIQEKAKDETIKLGEVANTSALNLESKKNEVQQRHLESEARLQELEEERQRRQSEAAALQEAALERRRAQEAERLARLTREEERRREVESRRESEQRERMAAKEARIEEKRREMHEKLNSKLEQGSKRHEEIVEQKKERAAAANAKVSAGLVNARRTPESGSRLLVDLPSDF
ncbi:hypothetical protein HK405_013656, partial [Cladochytrium tenue]